MLQCLLFRNSPQLTAAANNSPPLGSHSHGAGVACLQSALIVIGERLPISTKQGKNPPDGIFGTETTQALIRFQQRNGLVGDGVAGRLTLTRLDQLMMTGGNGQVAAAEVFRAAHNFTKVTGQGDALGSRATMQSALEKLNVTTGNDMKTSYWLMSTLLASVKY